MATVSRPEALGFASGIAASVVAIALGLPGRGEFIVAGWLAGFAAASFGSGWRGLGAVLLGVVLGLMPVPLVGGSLTFLPLIAVVIGSIAAHGWLTAKVVNRLRREGLAAARTAPVAGAIALLVLTLGAATWLAIELSANPP